jgi:hypothetical protein
VLREEQEIKKRVVEIYKRLVERGARHSQAWKDLWKRENMTPMKKMDHIYEEVVAEYGRKLPDGFKELWHGPGLEKLWNSYMR